MNKSVLVIDTPETCYGCPLCAVRVRKDKSIYFCNIPKCTGVDEVIRGIPNAETSKPNWCPLTPLPEYKDLSSIIKEYNGIDMLLCYQYEQGYNDCLNDIQKGEKQ